MRHLVLAGLLTGLLPFAVAACGDDKSGGLTKKEYVATADAICDKANEQETQAGAPGATGAIETNVLEHVVAIDGKALDEIRKLDAPKGDEDKVAKIVSDLEAVHSTRKDQLAAQQSNDNGAATKAQNAFFSASSDLGGSAGGYGLSSCQALGF